MMLIMEGSHLLTNISRRVASIPSVCAGFIAEISIPVDFPKVFGDADPI
jgi:hypothetical protein